MLNKTYVHERILESQIEEFFLFSILCSNGKFYRDIPLFTNRKNDNISMAVCGENSMLIYDNTQKVLRVHFDLKANEPPVFLGINRSTLKRQDIFILSHQGKDGWDAAVEARFTKEWFEVSFELYISWITPKTMRICYKGDVYDTFLQQDDAPSVTNTVPCVNASEASAPALTPSAIITEVGKRMSREKAIRDTLSSPLFDGIRRAFEKSGVSISFSPSSRSSVHRVGATFETTTGKGAIVIIKFEKYPRKHIQFTVLDPLEYEIQPLSRCNAEKWRNTAHRIGLPDVLRDVFRFTEFFIALIAVLGSKESFDTFSPGLVDTYTSVREDISSMVDTYYTCNDEVVGFPIVFGDPNTHFGAD